jgi:hypothetical protein
LDRPIPKTLGALRLYFKLTPSTQFSSLPGEFTLRTDGRFNELWFQDRETVKSFKVRINPLPRDARDQVISSIQTWIGNTTSTTAPAFYQKTFGITR